MNGPFTLKLHRKSLSAFIIGRYNVKASLRGITKTVAYLKIDEKQLTVTSAYKYHNGTYDPDAETMSEIINLDDLSASTDFFKRFLSECFRISDMVMNR